ncbi:MAG: bifunctional hydroxymethylpyrimidine kinase/phosphomethylpyrimidine kinase [Alphaproteobacteria bacterium]|nr:bifunctional hydroxymethylpyrimidine kinase/phosphomethylpyrimidine kinase [Alphaproteobacteria bacterium]
MTEDHATETDEEIPACVLSFNANDASGAAGLSADVLAIASVGAHPMGVVTACYLRDTAETTGQHSLDDEAVSEQARQVLEDVPVQVIKVGFAGSPENLSVIAEICADYADLPVVAYMPGLSWWDEVPMEDYLAAYRGLILPQATVLVGEHHQLWRWLLPDWAGDKAPTARDLASAAAEAGTPYTLVTGLNGPSDQHVENQLATPQGVLVSVSFERFEGVFVGAGETLSAALAGLLSVGTDLESAVSEALGYLDQTLAHGFRPGMGRVLPDRLFWAQAALDEETSDADVDESLNPNPQTRH